MKEIQKVKPHLCTYKVAISNLSPPSLFARSSKTALFFYFLFFGMFIIKESKLTIKKSAFIMLESTLNSEKTLIFEKKMHFFSKKQHFYIFRLYRIVLAKKVYVLMQVLSKSSKKASFWEIVLRISKIVFVSRISKNWFMHKECNLYKCWIMMQNNKNVASKKKVKKSVFF